MNELDRLAQHRNVILLAELAGLLHNIGKLNPNFLRSTVCDEGNAVALLKQQQQFMDGYAFKRFAKPSEDILDASAKPHLANSTKLDTSRLPGHPFSSDLEKAQQKAAETFNKFYRGIGPLSNTQTQPLTKMILDVSGEKWQLTDLLTLFWDEFFHKPNNNDYQRAYALDRWLSNQPNGLPHLLIHAHGEVSGSEKYQITEDDETGIIKTEDVTQAQSSFDNLRIASAFGYETEIPVWGIAAEQQDLINQVPTLSLDNEWWRSQFQAVLQHGLGDTQRPINEITLWDYASSVAALFKTSIAKSLLEGQVANANQMHWRLLGVRFDGLEYVLQADRISDLIGRQQKYQEVLDQVNSALTQETPIASKVYQDESGLFFVVPDSHKLDLKDLSALIEEQLQKRTFNDLRPHIDWNPTPLRGKQLNLGQEIKRHDRVRRSSVDPATVNKWWQNSSTQICEVCGLRPAISTEVKYCATCQSNRQSRVQAWLNAANSTIWLDEVADSNGRLALITGQFPLSNWLDGTLVESLALGMDGKDQPVSKFASFARVQRVWRTTQTFWQESQTTINQTLSDARRRLKIQLANTPNLTTNQTYELDLRGKTRMSVLWDGQHLISTDNLSYTAIQLGVKAAERKTPTDAALSVGAWLEGCKGTPLQLISDDERNRRFDIQIADVDYQDAAYSTAIPILAEPRTFMALVPADKALDVIDAIRAKYEREMGKVRNRLPLHLGVVYFQRRTPLRAALDAGRRMLKYKLGSLQQDVWTVQEVTCGGSEVAPQALTQDTRQFDQTIAVKLAQNERSLTWHVPAVMGDGVTPDNWYPYVFIQNDVNGRPLTFKGVRPTGDGQSEECWLIHASQLKAGDQVYFTPATFDYEWLDSGGQRFAIAYDEQGRRRGSHTRPYLLDDLETIQRVWKTLSAETGLSSSQIYALRDLVETKRETWQGDETFAQLCTDAVRNAQWKDRGDSDLPLITAAAISGLLTEVIQLYMGIMKCKPQREDETNA